MSINNYSEEDRDYIEDDFEMDENTCPKCGSRLKRGSESYEAYGSVFTRTLKECVGCGYGEWVD